MVFRGTHDYTLDAKGRLTVPARYRSLLGDSVVLAPTLDQLPCVGVWRPEDYVTFTARALADVPPLSPKLALLERFFFGNSFTEKLDAAGRVMLPTRLCQRVGLQREVVVVGAGPRLELWDRERWAEQEQAMLDGVAEITSHVGHPA